MNTRIARLTIVAAVIALFGVTYVHAQIVDSAPTKPPYDAELAKKVDANKYGMRRYVIAFLKTGPKDALTQGEARAAIFKGHFKNMERLAAEGKLAVAGPFSDPEKKFRGLFIFAVPTVEEAKKLAESDPVVKSGVMIVEYVPWLGSAALMLNNELHYKVQKESM